MSLMPLMRLTPPVWMGAHRAEEAPTHHSSIQNPGVERMSGMREILSI